MIDETYYGMRLDTFLPRSPINPPEKKQGWKIQSEQEKIRKELAEILERTNRLPD